MPTYESRAMADSFLNPQHRYSQINARVKATESLERKLSTDRALLALAEATGLVECEFLHQFHMAKFTEISGQDYNLEADKLKALSALLGLVISRFHYIELDVPIKLQRPLCDDTYCLSLNVYPWKTVDVSTWDKEFSHYVETWVDQQTGRRVDQFDPYSGKREPLYFDEAYRLRLDIAKEFSSVFLDHLKELLALKKSATITETLKRNLDLTDLLHEASRYTWALKSVMSIELKDDFDKIKGTDALSTLCVNSVSSVLSTEAEFDDESFQNAVIEILWDELMSLQKSDEQKSQVELIKRAMSKEIYSGITEEVE